MNNKAQFTPGPRIERTPGNWTVQHNNNDDTTYTYIVANDLHLGADMVAEIYRVSAYEGNANLIAAAPAMYLELQNIVEGLTDEITRIIEGNKPDTARLDYLANKAGQAVAQAEGRQP